MRGDGLYTVEHIRVLYDKYHREVVRHDLMSGVPCDEECGVEEFLNWLQYNKGILDAEGRQEDRRDRVGE